ncbi:MAG: SapC family protein [Rhodospirillales bacterium]
MPAPTPPKGNGGTKRPPSLPLLYRRLEPLSTERHANLRLHRPDDFSFARDAGVVPLTLTEFQSAAQYYPIVFLQGPTGKQPMPVAILGSRPQENLYVDAGGRWRPGHYVPAYLRRFPFITGDDARPGKAVVFVDVESDKLSASEGRALFVKGEATEFAKGAIELCQRYHQAAALTERFAAALAAAGVLADRVIEAKDQTGQKLAWRGMKAVDSAKLVKTDAKEFLLWRDRNWLAPIYLHQFSLGHFGEIAASTLAAQSLRAGKTK